MSAPLWSPGKERRTSATLTAFTRFLEARQEGSFSDYASLHRFSVEHMGPFWQAFQEFFHLNLAGQALVGADDMEKARFFPDATLNVADLLLRRYDDHDALVSWGEDGFKRRMSFRELRDSVIALARALRGAGVGPGDCCAGFVPNAPEAVIALLATVAVGATWTSSSPDFGLQGVVDRFGQTRPKVLFTADGYVYGGKVFHSVGRVREMHARMPFIEHVVIFPFLHQDVKDSAEEILGAYTWEEFIKHYSSDEEPVFSPFPFDHPLCIAYSSGTTGAPKCIVHRAGGVLINLLKEHALHCDIKKGDRVFFFSTCGWMMWQWLVHALALQATVLLYDGSPFAQDGHVLFSYAEKERMTLFGTSARYIEALRARSFSPSKYDLSHLRTFLSTGSPLLPEHFSYVYDHIKGDLHLASICGGTDILGCFMLGVPTEPVFSGELQAAGLGLDVSVFGEEGPVPVGHKGELVCTQPFPSRPLGFFGDKGGQRYHEAYFARYPNVWHHGDFVVRTHNGGFIVHGRSDATLNPGGVRIGTAEIYRQVLGFPRVKDALAVAQEKEGEHRVLLFVTLTEGLSIDKDLEQAIKAHIKVNLSPRHVPQAVIPVPDLPYTRSGKLAELPVKNVINHKPVTNLTALANPEALEAFYAYARTLT